MLEGAKLIGAGCATIAQLVQVQVLVLSLDLLSTLLHVTHH